ncbi:nucleoside hydrolase [Microdochium nivale]|nr:nucleoside hydrolase [Microdochium nivale]
MGTDSNILTSCFLRAKAIFTSSSPDTDATKPPPSPAMSPKRRTRAASTSKPLPDLPVFVDVPDVDNVLCCLSVIRGNPGRRINIVLAPRPVDFAVRLYPDPRPAFFPAIRETVQEPDEGLRARLAIRRIMTPFSSPPDWAKDIPDPAVREYFYEPDQLFRDDNANHVKDDTRLYMELSAYRFASFFRDRGVHHSRYRLFWDEESMRKIAPGMRHASHVPDYTYDFDKDLYSDHVSALQIQDAQERRGKLRTLCGKYIAAEKRKWAKFGIQKSIVGAFDDLIAEQSKVLKKNADVPLMVGGPFTEPLKWLKAPGLPKPPRVTAMACYIEGRGNILANQFNVHIDMSSAWEFLALVQKEKIPTLLVPTEVVKDADWRITKTDLDRAFQGHDSVRTAVEMFTNQSKALTEVVLYDWVAAIIARMPDVLTTRKVVPYMASESYHTEDVVADVPIKDEKGNVIRTERKTVKQTTMIPVALKPQPEVVSPSPDTPTVMLRVKEVEAGQESYISMCWTDKGEDGRIKNAFHQMVVEQMKLDLDPSRG